jgi:hypothetical protein
MNHVVLQRRQPGLRARALLDALQASVADDQRVEWNQSGHARLPCAGELDAGRTALARRLDELGDDWPQHIAIL